MSENLEGFQRKFLRGVAHRLKPVVLIGQKGLAPDTLTAIDEALAHHELIKVKFNEFKEKAEKTVISEQIVKETGAGLAGIIGHTAIFYRRHKDRQKRKITLPSRA